MFTRPIRSSTIWLICSALWLTSAAPALAGDWPMWRYDAQRSGASPDALPEDLHLHWVLELPTPAPAWPENQHKLQFDASYEPIVAGQLLIVPSMVSDHVTAYDTNTGQQRWRFYTEGPVRFAPIASKGSIYFCSDDGMLYCVDQETGKQRWRVRGGPADEHVIGNDRMVSTWPARGGPVLYDNTIYFAASIWPFMGTFIHAVNADSGHMVWSNSGSGSIYVLQQHHSPAFAGVAPQGYMAATEDMLLVSGGRTVPAGYDRRTGEYKYFHVEDRSFGKDAGGYEVIVGDKWYFNGGAMYRVNDGNGVLGIRANVVDAQTAYSLEGDQIVARTLKLTREEFTNRKGKKESRPVLPVQWKTKTDLPLTKLFIKAGNRLYGAGSAGLIAAYDVPTTDDSAKSSWQGQISDNAWNMIAGDDRLFVITEEGTIYCFGSGQQQPVFHNQITTAQTLPDESSRLRDLAAQIVDASDARQGYCLMLGAGNGQFVRALSKVSELHTIVLEPDQKRAHQMRRLLDQAGIYGQRAHVIEGSLARIQLPPYFASLLILQDLEAIGSNPSKARLESIYRCLRPYGGTALLSLVKVPSDQREQVRKLISESDLEGSAVHMTDRWIRITRPGAITGSAPWTHQYADPGNSVVSKDLNVKAPLGLLWFGGPSNARVLPRHGHGPSPQVNAGRLFIEGPDMIRAVDVYTGRLLWDRDLPGVGQYYDYTSHEPGANALGSNYVSMPESVYVAYGTKCLRLDAETGKTTDTFTLPPEAGRKDTPEWGYIGIAGDVLVGGAQPLSYWSPEFEVDQFKDMKDEQLEKLMAIIKSWEGFQPAGSTDKPREFIVENLNRMLIDLTSVYKIPITPDTLREHDPAWRKALNDLRNRLHELRRIGADGNDHDVKKTNRLLLELVYNVPSKRPPTPGKNNLERTASKRLVVMNRKTGHVRWQITARYSYRHNAVALGNGMLFCIDRMPEAEIEHRKRRGQPVPDDATVRAFDLDTGKELWHADKRVFGTWLGYSEEYDALVQAGSRSRDRLFDEVDRGIVVYQGKTGKVIWESDLQYEGPLLLHHDTIITQHRAYQLLTGKQVMRENPITGMETQWTFSRQYGCNTAIGSEHMLTFRSAAAGFYDLEQDSGTGNFGGFKSGCTSNLIVADGVLNAPDYTRTCTCSYQNQSSLALVHDPDVEVWTFNTLEYHGNPIEQVGINFGAPGDRLSDEGTLWLDHPSVGGSSPKVPVTVKGDNMQWYRFHQSRINAGPLPWVAASGIKGADEIRIQLAQERKKTAPYTVRLVFAETDVVPPGRRLLNIHMQGQLVHEKFDPAAEAKGVNRSTIKSFQGIQIADELTIRLEALDAEYPPILSGIEVVAEPAKKITQDKNDGDQGAT